MNEGALQVSEIPSEKTEMSSVNEASLLVRNVAEPRLVGDSVKAAITRAARRLGFSITRTKDIWYGDARRIDADEMDRLRTEAARAEADELKQRLLALYRSLAATDPNFHRVTLGALGRALRDMGCPLGAVDFRED